MKPSILFLSVFTLSVLGVGSANAQAPSAPVTRDEVRATLTKIEGPLQRRLKVQFPKSTLAPGVQPATRTEIVKEFMRLWKEAEKVFRFTPRPYEVYPEVLAQHNKGQMITDLTYLIRRGAVAPVGPLAWGPNQTISPREFGDALAMLTHQLSALAHDPSPKFTPNLQRP